MIDTHIHLNDITPKEALAEHLQRAQDLGIRGWIMPATTIDSFIPIVEISQRYSYCYPALGLHPWFLPEQLDFAILSLREAIEHYSPIAIGECGLDFSREDHLKQIALFEAQVALSVEYQLPLIIHSYTAVDSVLQILRRYPQARGVFHGINCSLQQLEQILALGFYLGFGGGAPIRALKGCNVYYKQHLSIIFYLRQTHPFNQELIGTRVRLICRKI